MTVDIKGKGGGRMTKITLHGFDVITGADAVHSVGMTKIVYPCVGKANTFHDTLEAVVHGSIRQIAAGLVGEYEAVPFPCIAGLHPHTVLLQLLKSEQLNHRGGQRQTTALVILWWREIIPSAFFLLPAELPFYRESTRLKVDMFPAEAEYFTFA